MRELLIFGVGPHAVEAADIVGRINREDETWNLLGFVSPVDDRIGEKLCGLPVFGLSHVWNDYPEAMVIPEYEWPLKAQIPRQRLATLIDPSALVSSNARIGLGSIIYPHCFVGSEARVGDFVFCLAGSVINHEDVIEDRVIITSSVTVAGNVHVEADCYLGQSCSIREMTKIGRGSLIGMGSVVLTDVAPNSIMVGNPARKLGARKHAIAGLALVRSTTWLARKATRSARRRARATMSRIIGVRGVTL